MHVRQYFEEWHESRKALTRASTFEAEGIYIQKHIIPYFESECPSVEEIKPINVRNYTRAKLNSGRKDGKDGGLSLVSVKKHLSIIKQAFDEAVVLEIIPTNPALVIKLPKAKKSPLDERTVFLSNKEAQTLIDGLKGHDVRTAVILALYYGLRRSEVLGLRWSAIDFERNTISINHTVVKNLSICASDNTKTDSSRRTFQLLPDVRKILLDLKENSNPEHEYIFSREDGTPWRPDCLTRTFQRQLKRINLPKMRFHDLRHSTASILFDIGWSVEDVKNWLGHSDIETTSNIYIHYKKSREVLVGGSISGLFTL